MFIKLSALSRLAPFLVLFSLGVLSIELVSGGSASKPPGLLPQNHFANGDQLTNQYQEYLEYLKKFEKKYTSVEEMNKHFKIYCENVKKIEEHNKTASSYKQGVNKFTDMNDEEFEAGYTMHMDMSAFMKRPDTGKPPESSANK